MRLYYTDSYATHFSSAVVSRSPDNCRIELQDTLFYPASGGQPYDTGTLAGIPVIAVETTDDAVVHTLSAALPEDVSQVEGEIDWPRRFDNMQQHSGQHLLSAVFAEVLGAATCSVHMGLKTSTIELEITHLTDRQIDSVEGRTAELVWAALPVNVVFVDAADAGALRKASERTGQLRVVEIAGIDRSACGGTHVRNTAEIGPVQIRNTEKLRGHIRAEFVCGERARTRAREDYQLLAATCRSLGVTPDELSTHALQLTHRAGELEKERKRLSAELARYRAQAIWNDTAPHPDGIRRYVQACHTIDAERDLAQAFAAHHASMMLLISQNQLAAALAVSSDAGVAKELLGAALQSLGGRGGGSAQWAQGSLPSAEALAKLPTLLGFQRET